MDRNFLDRRRHIQDLVFEEKQSIFISESTAKAGLESTVSVISADTGLFPEYRVLLSRKCQTTLILEKAMAEEEAVNCKTLSFDQIIPRKLLSLAFISKLQSDYSIMVKFITYEMAFLSLICPETGRLY